MKKWLKLNYKYYVVAFVVFLTWMVGTINQHHDFYLENNMSFFEHQPVVVFLAEAVENTAGLRGQFLSAYAKSLIVGFIILHGIMLWGQRNKSEREFLETLPVKREKIVLYRFVMDVITVIPAVLISCIVTYVHLNSYLAKFQVTLPWLASSVAGYGITLCSYVVFILGIMYFLESIVVRGDLKIITTAGCMGMFYLSMFWLYEAVMFGKDNIFNKFVGFIKMYSVGGNNYVVYKGAYGPEGYWDNKNILYDVYYQGQEYELSTYAVLGRTACTDGVVGMSKVELYLGYALAYLLIGALLLALAVYLTKKQDLAKQSFYFRFAPVMIGLLVFVTVFTFFFVQIPEYWYSCILLGLIAFLGFMYLTNGRRKVKL